MKVKRSISLTLVLSMVLTLFSTIVFPTDLVKAETSKSIDDVIAGEGYVNNGENGKFIAEIAPPVEGSIAISSAADLKKIGAPGGYGLDKAYHLTADIDLAGEEWVPIGTNENPFTGTFDGQGYVIRNMRITGECESAGLFGYVGGLYYNGQLGPYRFTPTFKNIGLEFVRIEVSFSTQSYAGGIFGKNHRGDVTIDNCYVTGQIKSGSMNSYVGGLAGYTQGYNPTGRMTIKDSYNGAAVEADGVSFDGEGYSDLGVPLPVEEAGSASAGGIVGWGADVYAVTNCHNYGTVTSDSTGASTAGGIVGFGFIYECDQVSLCSNRGEVKAVSSDEASNTGQRTNYSYAGGIVGYDSPNERITKITKCYNEGSVSAELTTNNTAVEIFAGGIGGRLNNQAISDCYNNGTISANNSNNTSGYSAGICGRVSKNSSVRRTYNTGTISGAKKGAIAGLSTTGSVIRSNFYQSGSADKGVAEGNGEDGAVALSLEQMKEEESFTGYDFSKIWGFKLNENEDMPILQAYYTNFTYTPTGEVPGAGYDFLAEIEEPKEGSIAIGSVEELQKIGKGLPLTGDYHLTTNLDMTGVNWEPINGFRGVFDGQGYSIHNLEIVGDYNYAGLFGKIESDYENTHRPVLKNIALENVYINIVTTNFNANYVGGLLGYNDRAHVSISNCYVTGEISSSGYTVQTGGLVGYNHSESADMFSITDCQNYTDVTSVGPGSAAGILAQAGYLETIENCHNYGKISATSTELDFCAAGGVIANIYKGNVINKCSNVGDVTALSSAENSVYAGGIVAYTHSDLKGVTLSNCYNTGYISATLNKSTSNTSGEMYAGGISGRGIGLNIEDSFNTGDISAIHNWNIIGTSGGIAGVLKNGSIRKSYSTGNISASEYVGGVIGKEFGYVFTRNTYWNSDTEFYKNNTVLQLNEKKGVGSGEDTTSSKTAAQLKQEATFTGFDFDEIWGLQQGDNSDCPVLRALNPTLDYTSTTSPSLSKDFIEEEFDSPKKGSIPIATREDLESIRNDLSGSYHLVADIDMTGIDWIPLGDNSTNSNSSRFTGTLDGQGHVITGLEVMTLENVSTGYSGLFGYVGGAADIRNLGLENVFIYNSSFTPRAGGIFGATFLDDSTSLSLDNCYVTGEIKSNNGGYVGGIAGNIYGKFSYVTNCYNSAKVTSSSGTNTSASYAGGITGYQGSGKIAGCYNEGNLSMSQIIGESSVGGIAGIITLDAGIINSYNKGKISISSKTSGYAGGIAGNVLESQCRISACYNTEEVYATTISTANSVKVEAGGIAGKNTGIINDCYNRSNIIVDSTSNNASAGGIIGEGFNNSVVSKCYSSGGITAYAYRGGIAGIANTNATVEASYWNKEATFKVGDTSISSKLGIGNGSGSAVGLTIDQMKTQSSFETFDFNDIWSIKSDKNDGLPMLQAKECMYTVSVSPDLAGAIYTKDIVGSWVKGDTVSIVAPEEVNYRFKEWKSSDVTVENINDATTTFTMPAKNISLIATYELIPSHYLTLNSYIMVNGSTVNKGSRVSLKEGQEISISAFDQDNKTFKEWKSANGDVQFADKTQKSTTFIMPDKDVTIEAVFEDILYTITVSGGTASLQKAKVGDLVTITSNEPKTGKSFSHWETGAVSLSNPYAAVTTFTMPDHNVTIEAKYQDKVKENQAPPATPVLSTKTSTSVTLEKIVGAEYKCNSGAWQDSPVFSGLKANKTYTFYARMKETQTHKVSASSNGLSVKTDKVVQKAPSKPVLSSKTSTSVTLKKIVGAEYKCNSGAWQDSPVFSGLKANKTYTFYARMKETQTHKVSANSKGLSVKTDKQKKKALTPVITKQPKSKTLKLKAKYTLSVKAKVKTGKLSYQWQKSTKKYGKFKNISGSAAKKSTYNVSTKKRGTYYYRCIITNTDKNAKTQKSKKTSKTVYIKVK